MKKGRISKSEEGLIKDNLHLDLKALGEKLSRDPNSVAEFIKRKVASGDFIAPSWLDENGDDTAHYNLISRPYWNELKEQFTSGELELFKYHWVRIVSQFNNEVNPTEEMQVVDLIKLDLYMNRCGKTSKENLDQIDNLTALITAERQNELDQQDSDTIFNMERQLAGLKASQESLGKDYRELQTKKNSMLKDMKGTRDQIRKRLEDSKSNFTSWMAHLISNPAQAAEYGKEMEMMRLAQVKEKERLSQFHKYTDDMVDQPFLTPETVKD